MKNLCSTSGQTLASLLVFMAVSAIIMTSTAKMLSSSGKATRGIASNIDLNEISNTFHLLTQNPANCEDSGLANVDATSLLAPSPLPVELSLGKPGQALLAAGTIYGGTRRVTSVSLSRLLANANPNSYLGTIVVTTEIIGKALTMRNPTLSFNLNITLDAAKKIISCYGAGGVDPDLAATNPSPSTDWKLKNIIVIPAASFLPGIIKAMDIVNGRNMIWRDTDSNFKIDTVCLDRNNNNIFDSFDTFPSPICGSNTGSIPYSALGGQAVCWFWGGTYTGCPFDTTDPVSYTPLGNVLMLTASLGLASLGAGHSTVVTIIIRDVTSGTQSEAPLAQHDGEDSGGLTRERVDISIVRNVVPGHVYEYRFRIYSGQSGSLNPVPQTISNLGSPTLMIHDYLKP